MKLNAVACLAFVGLLQPLVQSQQRPPTVDPTYGLPMPKPVPAAKVVPDAVWIWANQVADNQTIYLRREFRLNSSPDKAELYVTADNQFTAYVNGTKVSSTPVDPTDDNLWQRVQAVDVTSELKQGLNVIAIRAHNEGGAAGVLVRLEADSKPIILSGKSWETDMKSPNSGWMGTGFDAKNWTTATPEGRVGNAPWGDALRGWPTVINAVPNYLFHLPIKPVRWAYTPKNGPGDMDHLQWHKARQQMSLVRPISDSGKADWRVIFDFGKELAGRILAKSPTAGTEIGTGESIGEALNQPFTTSSTGATPYTALRYATITVPGQDQNIKLNILMDFLYYPVRYLGSFNCSDPLLNKVWYTGAYTAHLCMQQDIWDAPKRDRARWMGDLHVSGEVINNVFADKFLMEHTMSLLRSDAQGGHPEPELPVQYVNGIPGYSAAWFAGLADFYRHIGDKKFLASQHEAIISMLKFCQQDFNKQGIFDNMHKSWVYTDWSPGFDNDSPVSRATTDLFLIKGVKEAVYLLRSLGDNANADKYSKWAHQLVLAARTHLALANGTYGDRKEENAMAIYSGTATPAQRADIFQNGIFKPETGLTKLTVSPYYGNYLLRAMSLAGHTEQGLNYIRSFWGQMIRDGATTFYETYDPYWEKHNFHAHLQWDNQANAAEGYHVSLCHGWSAGPTNFLTECVLGVQSTGAGFKTCRIAPRLGDLKWATGVVPTPHGAIKVRVNRLGSLVTIRVWLPRGVVATVSVPRTIGAVDGKKVSTSSVELGAGNHTITGS